MVMRKLEHLTEEDEGVLEQLSQQSELLEEIGLAQSFLFIVRK
ncbi:hypothetical protein AM1_C0229 (plasmid) [Acaryochloris marina MBIC11017]|uniref:Uncharacterized protein n=1 Tax=Acaryochloris marina (strain MBIC 11017) TaxID=329726 RepID=A8ZMW4_ACAM1|nr:hypothetical protein AM1_C0229 [Acaryochloris marina MBIC11017]